jgi:hypothetical protein
MKVYYLYHITEQKPLTLSVTSYEEVEYCNDVGATLSLYGDTVWTTTVFAYAERVCNNKIEWYNSDITTPENNYVGKCEIRYFEV